MKLLAMAILMSAFGVAQVGFSQTSVSKKPPVHKCPQGQHWDAGMKMCMPN